MLPLFPLSYLLSVVYDRPYGICIHSMTACKTVPTQEVGKYLHRSMGYTKFTGPGISETQQSDASVILFVFCCI